MVFKKLCDVFAGVKMTIVSGIFLILSIILMVTEKQVAIDPAWVSVILSGYPLLYLAITRLIYQRWISSCLLISIAMIASLALNEIFAAGEVAFIMAIGAILEDRSVTRAKKGLTSLIELTPTLARLLVKDQECVLEKMVGVEELHIGDVIRIFPGERIPADGVLLVGETSVDQSIISGESLPVDKTIGDEVYCGTMNCFGTMDVKVKTLSKESSLQKMIRMVQDAENKKAPMQRIADQWSVWLVPIALGIAIAAYFVNYTLGCEQMVALKRGVTVLVVFCPCALALATPTSIMAAIGQATKHGIIIKSGEALEAMGKVDTITFDKTGTLTYGKLNVADLVPFFADISKDALLQLAASVEARSEHPLGIAIRNAAEEKHLTLTTISNFAMSVGRGVKAIMNDMQYYCGNEAYLKEQGIVLDHLKHQLLKQYEKDGKAIILVANQQECLGLITLCDRIREESSNIVSSLQQMDMDTILLTGDHKEAARYFANQIHIDEVFAELLPQDKVACIQHLKEQGKKVCMLGDGVNDALALKMADVGIAMGGIGSDLAIEASDIAFVKDDIKQLVYLNRLSKATIRTIHFNITLSMCINAVAITLSILGILNPVTGALVHNVGSCLVVLNAAFLYDRKFDK